MEERGLPVTVAVFTGLPGTGKSTLAERIAIATATPAFSGDWLMGALKPYGVLQQLDQPSYQDLYYGLIGTLMTRQLMLGQSAIIDCLVTDDRLGQWQQTAAQHGAGLVVVECVCGDTALHRSRVTGRRRNIPGWHEVDWDHVERMRVRFPPPQMDHVTVDSVNPVEHNAQLVLAALNRSPEAGAW